MSSRRMLRSAAVAATAAALLVSAIALPAVAKGPKPGRGPAMAEIKKSAAHGKSAQAKQRKAARVKAAGTLVAVGPDTVTVAVKGGDKVLRGTEAVFTVATEARISRDDVAATLAELVAGDHVAIDGLRTDGNLVATRLNASSPEPADEPTEDATETVTDESTDTADF